MPPDHDDEDDDTDDPVFVLGRRSSDDLTPDELDRRRSTKRFALWGLVVVVVIVAVAITLVALLVDTSGGAPRTPSAAAQLWARDLVRGDTSGRTSLECSTGAQGADTLRLVLTASTDARAGQARRTGRTAWRVPVTFLGPSDRTEASYTVDVVRRGGRYLVC